MSMSKQSSYHSFVDSKDSRKMQLGPKITKRLKHKELEAGKEEATAGHQPAAANNKTNPVKKKREKNKTATQGSRKNFCKKAKRLKQSLQKPQNPAQPAANSKRGTEDRREKTGQKETCLMARVMEAKCTAAAAASQGKHNHENVRTWIQIHTANHKQAKTKAEWTPVYTAADWRHDPASQAKDKTRRMRQQHFAFMLGTSKPHQQTSN